MYNVIKTMGERKTEDGTFLRKKPKKRKTDDDVCRLKRAGFSDEVEIRG